MGRERMDGRFIGSDPNGMPGGGSLTDLADLIIQAIVLDDTGVIVIDDESETVITDVQEI